MKHPIPADINILSESDIDYLNGLLEAAEWASDSAYQQVCCDLIAGCGEFKRLEPYDVWIEWVRRTAMQEGGLNEKA